MSGENGTAASPFQAVYSEITGQHRGSFVPEAAAAGISELTGIDIDKIRAALLHPPAAGSMYPDAVRFLSRLASAEDQYISIWTQGEMATAQGSAGYQLKKIGQAGVSGLLNPGWRSRNRAAGLPRVLGHIYDKSNALPSLTPALQEGGFDGVVIVDDRPDNHVRAHEALQGAGWDAAVHYLMNRSGAENGNGPEDFTVETVGSFDELSLERHAGSKTLWLVDLDYTLIDHKQVVAQYSRMIDELGEAA
jgi:hypothetical protein